ncbi:MAG TPA: cytochrome c biogenesis protein CcdA [Sphingobacteriaceae bacterium]|nr:cytochrome c biogenesis protein CcdA [Sphingobacteriaceae bacterium]
MNPELANTVGYGLAFAGGFVSFVSPCVLPLVPTYISFLAGNSVAVAGRGPTPAARQAVLLPGLAFVLGFSLIFIAFGLSASFIGQFLAAMQGPLRKISGVIVILFGLHMTGLLRLPFLDREQRLAAPVQQGGLFNAFLLGVVFSLGWTPCIGPILGTILLVASQTGNAATGAGLLATYSLGMALPFLVLTVLLAGSTRALRGFQRYAGAVRIGTGVLLVAMGVMLYTGFFARLSSLFVWSW